MAMRIETAPSSQRGHRIDDHVVLLDGRGRPSGTERKAEVHDRHTPLHLAFSCHIVQRDGSVLLTRRALHKPTWPGVWTNGCCGHPQLGETLREAVTRRLAEELGASPAAMVVALPDFTYRAEMGDGTVEHELCPVVVALVDLVGLPDPAEVADHVWTSWPDLVARAQRAPATLSPWCVEQIERLAVLPSLTAWLDRSPIEQPSSALDVPIAIADPAPLRTTQPAARRGSGAIDHVSEPLARVLDEFLDHRAANVVALDPRLAEVTDEILGLVRAGGKRLRPAFVYWGHRSTGAEHDDEVFRPAAAVELLHSFALLHDDVMDRSATRRGRPSGHSALAQVHRTTLDPGRDFAGDESAWFGCSAAILAGDLTYVWADELFESTELPAPVLHRARREFTELRTEVIAGQYLDLRLAADPTASEESAARVALLKSARYTVTRPLLLGAALGELDAAAHVHEALHTYGDAVGLAFQMRDDLLGLFGDPEETGKSVLDDLREGKRTVVMLRALRLADRTGRSVLERSLGDPTLDDVGAERVRDIVVSSGALASIEALVAAQHALAVDALDGVIVEPARSALRQMASLAVERRA